MTTEQTVLVVDDESLNRDMLSRRLRRAGFAVLEAESGPAALRMVEAAPVDLVLLDNMMPGLSGVEVLEQLRRRFSAAELPVIMVTAQAGSDHVVKALESGANDYITKPVDFAVATARIRTQLSRQSAERELRDSAQRYELAAQGSQEGVWDWHLASGEVFYSARWKAILGYGEDGIGNTPGEWLDRIHPGDAGRVRSELEAHIAGATTAFESEYRIRHRDGGYRWVNSRGSAVRDAAGRPLRVAGSQVDITHAKLSDPVTGMPNRLCFVEHLAALLDHGPDRPERGFAVLALDFDGIQAVNRTLGQATAGRVLAAAGARIQAAAAQGSLVAHLGSGEFVVAIPGVHDAAGGSRLAESIRGCFLTPLPVDGRPVPASVSVGIVTNAAGYASPEELLLDAGTALNQAKSAAGSRCAVFEPGMRTQAATRLRMESELRSAVENRQLEAWYQPKMDLLSGTVLGFEALVRWRAPQPGCAATWRVHRPGGGDRPDYTFGHLDARGGLPATCAMAEAFPVRPVAGRQRQRLSPPARAG